jgi:hypothetical protein
MDMHLMASEEAALPKRLAYFELRRLGLISSRFSNLGISEVNQGKRTKQSQSETETLSSQSYACLKAPSRQKPWSKWV